MDHNLTVMRHSGEVISDPLTRQQVRILGFCACLFFPPVVMPVGSACGIVLMQDDGWEFWLDQLPVFLGIAGVVGVGSSAAYAATVGGRRVVLTSLLSLIVLFAGLSAVFLIESHLSEHGTPLEPELFIFVFLLALPTPLIVLADRLLGGFVGLIAANAIAFVPTAGILVVAWVIAYFDNALDFSTMDWREAVRSFLMILTFGLTHVGGWTIARLREQRAVWHEIQNGWARLPERS